MKQNKGFTLVELMIAMVVSGLVMIGIIEVYVRATQTYTGQEALVSAQEGLRGSLDIISMNLSMAGFDPVAGVNPAPAAPDFGIELATPAKLRFTIDNDMDGVLDNDTFERVTYEIDAGTNNLTETLYEGTTDQEGPNTLIGNMNVTDSRFAYFDEDGNALAATPADLSEIRTVLVLLVVDEPAGRYGTIQRRMLRRVTCPNLYF